MKKTTVLTALLLCSRLLFAQDESIQKGSVKLSAGLGLGSYIKIVGGKTTFPPITGSVEFAIDENTTIGPVVGYTAVEEQYYYPSLGWDDTYRTSNLLIGAKGNYYFVTNRSWEVYGGGFLGYDIVSTKLVSKNNNGMGSSGISTYSADIGGFLYGVQVGARRKFSPNIAAFAELGYGIAVLNIGLTFSLSKK